MGLSSKEILNNVLQIKKTGCDISISTVYNNDYSNIYKLVKWCLNNKIRIKIIEEIENKVYEQSSEEYLRMRDKIFRDFNLKLVIDGLEEYNGYLDDFKAVSFFPSLCRLRRCDLCKKIHIRITSEGKIKQCIHYSDEDKSVIGEDCRKNILEAIEKEVNYHM